MTPQDYVNLTIKKLSEDGSATAKQIIEYCIANSKKLDPGDERKIEKIVYSTLEPLCYYGHISLCAGKYRTECDIRKVQGIVFDDPPKMSHISKNMSDAINEIDKRISYENDPSFIDENE